MPRRRLAILVVSVLAVVGVVTTAHAVTAPRPITMTGCFNATQGVIDKLKWASTPLSPCDAGERIVKVSGGDITSVLTNPGSGLTGGGLAGDLSLSVDFANLDARYVNEGQANAVSSAMLNATVRQQLKCAAYPRAHSNLTNCNLSGIDLHGINMFQINLAGADLSTADFTSAVLNSASLTGATMHLTVLSNASVNFADLSGANLQHAALNNTGLFNTNLSGADLTDADLTGAVMSGATITGVTWSNTTCPDGTNSDNDGGTCAGHV